MSMTLPVAKRSGGHGHLGSSLEQLDDAALI